MELALRPLFIYLGELIKIEWQLSHSFQLELGLMQSSSNEGLMFFSVVILRSTP